MLSIMVAMEPGQFKTGSRYIQDAMNRISTTGTRSSGHGKEKAGLVYHDRFHLHCRELQGRCTQGMVHFQGRIRQSPRETGVGCRRES